MFILIQTRPRGYTIFSCSTQLSMAFQLPLKTKMLKNKDSLAFNLSGVVFIILINVKMQTIVDILTFMSMINFMLCWVEHEKNITSRPGLLVLTFLKLKFWF